MNGVIEPSMGKCPDCGGGIIPDKRGGHCVQCGQPLGDCYAVACRFVVRHEGWTLVHGLLLSPRRESLILKKIYHAWAEKNDTVWEGQVGKAHSMPKAIWYRFVEEVQGIYPRSLAAYLLATTNKWGPWKQDVVRQAIVELADLRRTGAVIVASYGGKEYHIPP